MQRRKPSIGQPLSKSLYFGHPLLEASSVLVSFFSAFSCVIRQCTLVANLGLFGYTGYKFYSEPHLRHDHMFVTSTIAGAAVVLGLEGYGAQTFAPVREEEDVLIQYVRQNPNSTRTLFAICKLCTFVAAQLVCLRAFQ